MLNKVALIGNLGKDIEVRTLNGGQLVANARLATTRTWTDKATGEKREETEWHDIELWGKTAKNSAEYVGKGSRIYVEGRLKTDRWEKDGQKHSRTKIVAETVKFLNGKAQHDDANPEDEQAAAA